MRGVQPLAIEMKSEALSDLIDRDAEVERVATGLYLNSPNDVITRSDGTIYFTDPGFGRVAHFGIPREQELSFQGVYMIPAGGGDPHVVEKLRMNGFYETRLDILLRGLGVDSLVIAGCYTNMSIEHTARRTSRSPSGTSASSRGASSRTGTAMPLVCGRSAGRCHTIEPGRVLGEKTGGFHEHDDDPRRPDPTD